MRQNKRENGVMKSRSLSNDAMVRPHKRDESMCIISRSLCDEETKQAIWMCNTSRSFSLDETKQARQMSNTSRS